MRRDRRGTASVEAALAVSIVMVPLALGLADIGAVLTTSTRLDRAVQAATFHVWANPLSFTAATVAKAASDSYGAGTPALKVTSSTSCSCVTGAFSPVSAVACTLACPTGLTRATYVTVAVSTILPLPAPVLGLVSPRPLATQATVRVQ